MVMIMVRVRVRVFQDDVVCSRGFLKFLFGCKLFYCVLQCSRGFQYLPLGLWYLLGLGLGLELGCSRLI